MCKICMYFYAKSFFRKSKMDKKNVQKNVQYPFLAVFVIENLHPEHNALNSKLYFFILSL